MSVVRDIQSVLPPRREAARGLAADTVAETGVMPATAARPSDSPSPELVTLTDPCGDAAERFRSLRSQLGLPTADGRPARRVLAITSTDAGDGRSWCAANLAVSMAQRGGPVLLVDADLRSPRQQQLFGLHPQVSAAASPVGLSALLEGRADLAAVRAVPQVPGLFVLTAGAPSPNPLALIERPAFAELLADLAQRFAHVVLDTPPLGRTADAAVLAGRAQQALLVVRQHHSSHRAVQAAVQALARHGATLAGVMLNAH